MSRRPAALALALMLVALLPGAASAAPPVAGDDPGLACMDGAFGGSFPIPEDAAQVAFVDGHPCGISYNDSDPDGDALAYALVTPPAHGDLEYLFSVDSTVGYTPDPDYFTLPGDVPGGDWSSDSFVYEVTAGGETDQATMRFWIAPVNDAPTFTGGGDVTVAEDSGAYSAIWATAISEGPGESYQSVAFDLEVDTNGVPGLFAVAPAIAPNGTLTFTPAANKAGIATVTVVLKDDGGLESYSGVTLDPPPDDTSDAVEFDIIVTAENDAPVARDDPSPFGAPDGDGCDGNVHTGWALMVPEDSAELLVFEPCTPVGNDLDADGDALSWEVVDEPMHGTFGRVDGAGAEDWFTYQPDPDFGTLPGDLPGAAYTSETGTFASDWFTYRAFDGTSYSNVATYTFWVVELNDEPTFTPGGTVAVDEDSGPYSATWATNVSPGPALEASQTVTFEVTGVIITGPSNLFLTAPTIAPNGTLSFTPRANLSGSARVTVRLKDDGGTEDYGMGFLTQAQRADDTSDPVTFTITVAAENDPPTADDDSITVLEDAAATSVPVLVGDADIDGDTLTITGRTNGAKGTVVITGGGTGLTYTPGANLSGADAFTYTVSDGNGGTATATVAVTITPIQDDMPNAVNDTATVPTGPAVAIPVLGNDTDLDGDPLTITSRTNGAHGTVVITGGGSGLTYDPAPLFSGTDSFTYTVFDGFDYDTATVLVTVTPDVTAPTLSGLSHALPAQTLSGSSPRVRLSWAGADPGSGIANYHLQLSVNGGAYVTVALSSPTATAYERTLSPNTTYRFRIRAKDRSGNIGGFSSFQALNPVVLQEGTSLATYTGAWSTSTNASMSGGKGRFTTSSTRRVSFTFTGKAVGWVTTRTTSSGRAAVYLDGVLATTIDLDATAIGYRRMVYRSSFATAGRHTIEIRPLGDGRVDIDAFVILR